MSKTPTAILFGRLYVDRFLMTHPLRITPSLPETRRKRVKQDENNGQMLLIQELLESFTCSLTTTCSREVFTQLWTLTQRCRVKAGDKNSPQSANSQELATSSGCTRAGGTSGNQTPGKLCVAPVLSRHRRTHCTHLVPLHLS